MVFEDAGPQNDVICVKMGLYFGLSRYYIMFYQHNIIILSYNIYTKPPECVDIIHRTS